MISLNERIRELKEVDDKRSIDIANLALKKDVSYREAETAVTREEVFKLACSIAAEKHELTGRDYFYCVMDSMEEVCKQLGLSRKDVIKMWMEG